MAATTQRDINLVIRAKDEASKAIEAIGGALASLANTGAAAGDSATKTGADLQRLTDLALSLDKAYGRISAAADNAGSAFGRQQDRIEQQKAALQALEAQAQAAAKVIAGLQGEIERSGEGADTSAIAARLKAAQTAAGQLDGQIGKLTRSITQNEAALDGQRSSLQQVGSLAIAAEQAQQQLGAAVNQTTRALQEQARAAQVAPTIEAATGLTRDRGEYEQLIAQIKAESDAHEQLIAKLREEQEQRTLNAQQQEAQSRAALLLPGNAVTGKSARDSAAVFTAADRAADEAFAASLKSSAAAAAEMDTATQRLRNQLNPLATIQSRLNNELAQANALYKAGRISADELSAAEALLRANAERAAQAVARAGQGGKSPFGLQPYQLQNLGYQVNDIVTQLASGTSLEQTMAQQGGQLIQIFPQIGSAIGKAFRSPTVLAFAAALGAVIAAVVRLRNEQQGLREFGGALAATADAGEADAHALQFSAEQMERFGVKAKDATAIVKVLLSEGVNPAKITEFGQAAKDMADVLGVDVKDAAKKLTDGFTGGYESVRKLDQATNFLTATERDHIRTLFDENRAQEGRTEAFRIFAERYDDAAGKMRGPWAQAVRELHNAWTGFLDALAENPLIEGAVAGLNALAEAATGALHALNGNPKDRTLAEVENAVRVDKQIIATASPEVADAMQAQLERDLADLKRLQDAAKQSQDTQAQQTNKQAKATEDLKDATAELGVENRKLTDQQRIDAAVKKANSQVDKDLENERFKLADEASKAAYRAAEVAKARQETERKITQEKEAQLRADEQAVKAFANKVPQIEASNNPLAKNSASTATGLGQFTEKTWLDLFRKYYPEQTASMGRDAILALRKDTETTKAMIEALTRENANYLKQAGISITQANLYLAHFLGAPDAAKVIKAADGAPVSSLVGAASIRANPKILQGKTAADVRSFAENKVGESSATLGAEALHLQQIEQERLATQEKFDQGLVREADLRRQQIEHLTEQNKLQDTALLAAERKATVEDAVKKLEDQVAQQNEARRAKGQQDIVLTQKQKDAVAQLAGAWFDVAHARDLAEAATNEVDRPVRDLTQERDALRERIQQFQSLGDSAGADRLRGSLDDVNAKLRDAIDAEITFYENLDPKDREALHLTQAQIDAIILRLKSAKTEAREWGQIMGLSARDIAQAFANDLTSAVSGFFDKLQQGENVFQALGESVRDFAANFLRAIAQMLTQLLAWAAAVEILRALGVPIPGGTPGGGFNFAPGGDGGPSGGFNFAPTNHTGGIVGRDRSGTRLLSPAWFADAFRYHGGGIAGLRPDEVPTILQQGEEVLTQSDPRHRNNAGGQAPRDRFKIVNLFDSGDVLAAALSTRVGEKVLLNHVRSNASAFKQALNG